MGDGPAVRARYPPKVMGDTRQRRAHRGDERVNADFWARGKENVVKARVATALILIGAVAVIAGLVWLAVSAV